MGLKQLRSLGLSFCLLDIHKSTYTHFWDLQLQAVILYECLIQPDLICITWTSSSNVLQEFAWVQMHCHLIATSSSAFHIVFLKLLA